MECRAVQMMITAYLGDEVVPGERREFEEHVAACDCCREELTSLRQIWDRLDHWPVPAVEPWIERGVLARVEQEAVARRPRIRLIPAAAAALLAALLSIAASVLLPYERAFELCRLRLQGIGVLAGVSDGTLFFIAGLFYSVIPLLLTGLLIAHLTDGGTPFPQGTATGAAFALLMAPYVLIVCSSLPGAFTAAILAGIGLGGLSGGLGGFWLGAQRWRPAR